LEQFEPVPYLIALKWGFFYIIFTNVTYIFLLVFILFYFINGPLGSYLKFDFALDSLFIKGDTISLSKTFLLPINFLVFFIRIIFLNYFLIVIILY